MDKQVWYCDGINSLEFPDIHFRPSRTKISLIVWRIACPINPSGHWKDQVMFSLGNTLTVLYTHTHFMHTNTHTHTHTHSSQKWEINPNKAIRKIRQKIILVSGQPTDPFLLFFYRWQKKKKKSTVNREHKGHWEKKVYLPPPIPIQKQTNLGGGGTKVE